MKKLTLALLATTLLHAAPAAAQDDLFDFGDKSRWMIRARAINVMPDESSKVTGLPAGTKVKADFAWTPELDFTYFFTDHVAAELIAATSQHDMSTNTGINLGDVWVLPPQLTMQYHFNPGGQFRPYAGAGLGYMIYYGEDSGAVNNIDYENGISYTLQAGMDYAIDEHWALNADVKKLWHNTDVSINNGAIRADVDLDPWVFGMGIGYRF